MREYVDFHGYKFARDYKFKSWHPIQLFSVTVSYCYGDLNVENTGFCHTDQHWTLHRTAAQTVQRPKPTLHLCK